MVERSPEKAGVGGSIPSLATISIPFKLRAALKGERVRAPDLSEQSARAKPWKKIPEKAGIGGSIPSLATTLITLGFKSRRGRQDSKRITETSPLESKSQ